MDRGGIAYVNKVYPAGNNRLSISLDDGTGIYLPIESEVKCGDLLKVKTIDPLVVYVKKPDNGDCP